MPSTFLVAIMGKLMVLPFMLYNCVGLSGMFVSSLTRQNVVLNYLSPESHISSVCCGKLSMGSP